MRDDLFEWDDEKAAANHQLRQITFQQAARAFNDPNFVEARDGRHDYGEERYNRIGMVGGVLLNVTYTLRGVRVRIISARRARRDERENYHRIDPP